MNLKFNNRSFTLIELVIVLSILAIIASAAVSAFVDIANKALGVQEDATMRALQSASLLYYARNNRWWGMDASEDPFNLLENPPPHKVDVGPATANVDWFLDNTGGFSPNWLIYCPHSWMGGPNWRGKIWNFSSVGAMYDLSIEKQHFEGGGYVSHH
ncbi:MAG: type II secretion system protein [Candidatus Omnitrophota bacterium]